MIFWPLPEVEDCITEDCLLCQSWSWLGNNETETLGKKDSSKDTVDKILRMGIECKDICIPCKYSSKNTSCRRDSQSGRYMTDSWCRSLYMDTPVLIQKLINKVVMMTEI